MTHRSTIGILPATDEVLRRRRSTRTLRTKAASRIARLAAHPRSEIPLRGESRRPTWPVEPAFYRALLREAKETAEASPERSRRILAVGLRLTPYLRDDCLAVQAWAFLADRHRLDGRYRKARAALDVAFEAAAPCPACQAFLHRPLALLLLCQKRYDPALEVLQASIEYYQGGYDRGHDLEPDSFAATLGLKAEVSYRAGHASDSVYYAGRALERVCPKASPELYKTLVLRYPSYVAASGDQEGFEEADRWLDAAAYHLQSLPRPSVLRARYNWARWKVKYRLTKTGPGPTARELGKCRKLFLGKKMGPELAVVTVDVARLRIAQLEAGAVDEVRQLVGELGELVQGQLVAFEWIPESLHGLLRRIHRTAASPNPQGWKDLDDLLAELREAAGGAGIMPI